MEVNQKFDTVRKKRLVEIVLNRQEYDELDSGCPSADFIIGKTENGTEFLLYSGNQMPSEFNLMPEGDGYYATIGLPIGYPTRTPDDLRKAINSSSDIPIKDGPDTNLGYARIRVEF